MTATSLRNALPFRNALRVVRQNQKMTIVTCILYLLGIPLSVAALMWELIYQSRRSADGIVQIFGRVNAGFYAAIGIVFLGVAVFMGMFDAIHSFTELHKKTKVDMLYALPLTGRQRFFSNYLGGCLIYIAPYLITVLLGWIVMFAMLPFVNWNGEYAEYTSFGAFMGEFGKIYGLGTLGLLLLMLLYYTLSVLITVCCGTLFESIYTNFLLNCLIPGTVALIIAIITNELSLDFEYNWQIIGFMSPIGGLIYLALLLSGDFDSFSYTYAFRATQTATHEMLPQYIRWALVILVLTAALLVLAWQLYIRRKAEHVGKPFIYIGAYYVMLILITVSILCLMEAEVFGPAILFSAIVYFVMEVIRKRGFKKFWLSILTYIGTVAVSIGCFALITATGCFGRVNYVPASLGVSSVRIELEQYTLEYTDRDVISEVTKLHRDIVGIRNGSSYYADPLDRQMLEEQYVALSYNYDYYYNDIPQFQANVPYYGNYYEDYNSYGNYEYYEDYAAENSSDTSSLPTWFLTGEIPEKVDGSYTSTVHLELTYYTITGSTIHRSYQITTDERQRMLGIIQGTDLYAEASAKGLSSRLNSIYSQYDSALGKSVVPDSLRLTVYAKPDGSSVHSAYIHNAPAVFEKLADAYRTDLAAMTAEDFRTADYACWLEDMQIYECCTNTLELLHGLGIHDFNTAERYNYFDRENSANDSSRGFVGIRIYAPDKSRTACNDYPHSSAADIYFKYGDPDYEDFLICADASEGLEETYPEMYALLSAAKQNYITDGDCYMLNFCGETYVIPENFTSLAETVIAKGSLYEMNQYLKELEGYGIDTSDFYDSYNTDSTYSNAVSPQPVYE